MVSSNVSAGDTLLASQYNDLRTDVVNTSTGHDHDGSDSKKVSAIDLVDRIVIEKAADELVNNSTTLQNDDDFAVTVGANDVWHFRLILRVSSPTATPDMRMAFSMPASGGGSWWSIGAIVDVNTLGVLVTAPDGLQRIACDSSERYHVFEGTYIGGGSAGTLQFQWAQFTATAENTTLHKESMLIADRES